MANTTIHICALCRREIKNSGLGIHLNNAHKNQITYQQYFDQFIDSKEHSCICGKPLKFNGLTSGYSKTCGDSKCIHVFQKEGYKNKTGYDYAWQNPECKEKSRKTLKEKTGFEYAMQNPATKQLSKAICLEKYGVENIAQNEEIKVRSENTKEARYGDKHFNNHCKTVKTCLEKYGVENTFQDENFKIKAEKTKKRKYGSSTFHNTEKTKRTCITRYGKPHYVFTQEERRKGNLAKRVKAFKRFLNSNRFKGKATPLFNVEEYTGIWGRYAFECNFCHRIFYSNLIHGGIPRCLKCEPKLISCSKGEKELEQFVSSIVEVEKEEKSFKINGKMHILDVYIPEKKIAIEHNGIYWHSEIPKRHREGKDKHFHIDRYNAFQSQGIQILNFYDSEWIDKQDIVKSMICAKLGKSENRIFARKCSIELLSFEVTSVFLENNHLQGSCSSSTNIGLYFEDNLVAVMTFGKSRLNKNYDYELLRYCTLLNTSIVGGFSRCLAFFRNSNEGSIISYANKRYSNGNVYEKNGFVLLRESEPNYFYTKDHKHLESRMKYQKHKLSKLLKIFDYGLSEWENMQLNGYDRIWDCGNFVYILK